MCTAITFKNKDFYFGRNLDLEYHYEEAVTITPRKYSFNFRNGIIMNEHYAMIGIATISKGYPLYYEAVNEKGLAVAGLNFPDNAKYHAFDENKINLAPFELIPYILGTYKTVDEAMEELHSLNIWDVSFDDKFQNTPLHWILADEKRCVTLEPCCDGLNIYENPVGVLTNNPPFGYHMHNIANYMNLSPETPENRFSKELKLKAYSLGMGSFGLPGDPSSASRFIKAAFVKLNSVAEDNEEGSVGCFFHILESVAQQCGITLVRENRYEYTVYSSCCNATKGVYYYTTYDNRRIVSVDMNKEDKNGSEVISYPLIFKGDFYRQN